MDIEAVADRILDGDRRALARAITLVESGREDHRAEARALLERLKGAGRQALRIGLRARQAWASRRLSKALA